MHLKYTIEELLERIHRSNQNDLVGMMTLVIGMKMTDASRARLAEIIMGSRTKDMHYANLALDRTISINALKDMAASEMMDYIEPLITAAMDPAGPFQSTEIMLLAANIAGHKPFYMGKDLARIHKTQAGYILSMAGLERKSHFDRDRRSPIKAWKPRRGEGRLTVKQRVEMVRSIMREYLRESKPTPTLTLENLI